MNRVYCIGCGESLKGFDFNVLNKHNTIGCNNLIFDYPKLKYGIFLDTNFYKERKEQIDSFAGIIYCDIHAIPVDYRPPHVRPVETFQGQINTSDCFNWLSGRLSGLAALNLAVVKGFDPIYLLGYDMKGSNYYDNSEVAFSKDDYCMGLFKEFSKYNIINLNPDSHLECFKKMSFEDHLNHS